MGRTLARFVPRVLFEVLRRRLGPLILFAGRREAEAVARFRALRLSGFDRAYRTRLAMVADLDIRSDLGRVSQPVYIVVGTWDLVVDSVRQAHAMASLLPRVRVDVVPRGGHLLLPLRQLDWRCRLEETLAEAGPGSCH